MVMSLIEAEKSPRLSNAARKLISAYEQTTIRNFGWNEFRDYIIKNPQLVESCLRDSVILIKTVGFRLRLSTVPGSVTSDLVVFVSDRAHMSILLETIGKCRDSYESVPEMFDHLATEEQIDLRANQLKSCQRHFVVQALVEQQVRLRIEQETKSPAPGEKKWFEEIEKWLKENELYLTEIQVGEQENITESVLDGTGLEEVGGLGRLQRKSADSDRYAALQELLSQCATDADRWKHLETLAYVSGLHKEQPDILN